MKMLMMNDDDDNVDDDERKMSDRISLGRFLSCYREIKRCFCFVGIAFGWWREAGFFILAMHKLYCSTFI